MYILVITLFLLSSIQSSFARSCVNGTDLIVVPTVSATTKAWRSCIDEDNRCCDNILLELNYGELPPGSIDTDLDLTSIRQVLPEATTGIGIDPTCWPGYYLLIISAEWWTHNNLTLDDMVTLLEGTMAGTSGCIQVSLDGWYTIPQPRCDANTDETCVPLPYNSEFGKYDPDLDRYIVDEKRSGDTCEQDGECVIAGCGNDCVSYIHYDIVGTCEYRTTLDYAFCGCVQNECVWFTQEFFYPNKPSTIITIIAVGVAILGIIVLVAVLWVRQRRSYRREQRPDYVEMTQ